MKYRYRLPIPEVSRNLTCFLTALTVLASSCWAHAETITYKSPGSRVELLELYTSEGCSSCPPADRWLSKLVKDPDLWTDFIPLAFHVDYWDYIGWKDRFASPLYSQRQRRYAREQSLRTVYTPGFILNGREWRRKSGKSIKSSSSKNPGYLTMQLTNDKASLHFSPNSNSVKRLNINLALLGFGLSTQVKAGENHGRKLVHEFVVLDWKQARLSRKGNTFTRTLSIPESEIIAERYALVAWVDSIDNQLPLQAVGGWLP